MVIQIEEKVKEVTRVLNTYPNNNLTDIDLVERFVTGFDNLDKGKLDEFLKEQGL